MPAIDFLGLTHTAAGIAALVLGFRVVLGRKGTPAHRRDGMGYAVSMLLLNATGLMIYDLSGAFGPFHVASLASLATLAAGLAPMYLRRSPSTIWRHAIFMSWSYVGLLAAFASEIGTRIPGADFGLTVIAATALVVLAGAIVIHTRVPRVVKAL